MDITLAFRVRIRGKSGFLWLALVLSAEVDPSLIKGGPFLAKKNKKKKTVIVRACENKMITIQI